jgi:hypothetical protein
MPQWQLATCGLNQAKNVRLYVTPTDYKEDLKVATPRPDLQLF